MRRSLPALIAIAVVAGAALTGCTGNSIAASAACDVKSGSGSESIRATGAFGKDPEARVPSPLNVSTAQSTTLIRGDGKVVGSGGLAVAYLTVFDGPTGEPGGSTAENFIPVNAKTVGAGLAGAIGCARVGSRLAIVLPGKQASAIFGSPAGDSVSVIADITRAFPNRATGRARPATPGFPTVVLAPNGQPGIVIGSHAAPTKAQSAVLRQGEGAVTTKKDALIIQTQIVTWSDQTSATGTWENGAPTAQGLTDGSVLAKELLGQRVGSQVIVLTPASKSQDGNASATVVDILGTVPAASLQQQ